jgi:biotin transport system substrate-specific component
MTPTLSAALIGPSSLWKKAAMILAGSALVAVSAQIEVPMFPVPMTLQTLAITLIGLTYGARLGFLTLFAYLAEGAAGLPVFAGGAGGLPHFVGPTAGFLLGFPLMAWATGALAENGFGRSFWRLFLAGLIPAALLFVPGAGWPLLAAPLGMTGEWTGLPFSAVWAGWVAPFVLGTFVKTAIAALIVSGAWAALRGRLG